ncbi:MAG: lysine--tRNA ligase [Deltaproteobacteria bacterium]|nr:lysine--tRNA ligase [Deltaproteobacteria bacterium]MBN2688110.1 lysine--tRNA ligase [Deltaproteobacteria bacterium]
MSESELLKTRREKIESLKADGVALYPNDVEVTATTEDIFSRFGELDNEALEKVEERFALAGRIMAVRNFGKAAFISIQDRKGRIQAYIRKNIVGDESFSLFQKFDVGDIISVAGRIFKTKTEELTVQAETVRLLSKAIHPLPEKWHGLTDVETRYRNKHLDLIVNPSVRDLFQKRSRIIRCIRDFMYHRDFLEVETPMMHSIAGGAMAKPFKTYHNALGMDLYLRIAPELYLKRLVVGGLERVFELNRNFRNEGVSTLHNPEFTMMEFYMAYATYEDLMAMTEDLLTSVAREIVGSLSFTYQGIEIDLTPPWKRVTVQDAVIAATGVDTAILNDREKSIDYARGIGLDVPGDESPGKVLMAIFEAVVEETLVQPTFITRYPLEVSPLSRKADDDERFTDRFELYIAGREIANAFSELNDPVDQRDRFLMQMKEREAGDLEAHEMDEDYIRALEYAMPPTAGEGIGIDRLVMLFTDSPSIRDVILFPHMRMKT